MVHADQGRDGALVIKSLSRLLLALHRDERAQVAPLFVLGAIALVLSLALLLNTGAQSARRIEVQNAADAAAMTQAVWTARSLDLMSMNNVATVQMVALNATVSALIPVLTEASLKAGRQLIRYGRNASACPVWPCVAFWLGMMADLTHRVILPLERIWSDNPLRIQSRSAELATTLARMNETIVDEFPAFTARVQREQAKINGLRSAQPRFYTRFEHSPREQFKATALPVERMPSFDFPPTLCTAGTLGTIGPNGLSSAWTSLSNYCKTGGSGSGDVGDLAALFGNFDDHGYPAGRGPYPVARDGADRRITPPVDALEGFPHYTDVALDFKKSVCAAWTAACAIPGVIRNGIQPRRLALYKLRNRPTPMLPLGDARADFSLLAFVQVDYPRAPVVGSRFENPSKVLAAFAQGECYNPIAYDLYTQDWRGRLVPARLLEQGQRSALLRSIRDFDELRNQLSALSQGDLDEVNTH